MSLEKIAETIRSNDSFVILGHKNGDSDCYGAAFGLSQLLTKLNKQSFIYIEKDFPENLGFLFNYFNGEVIYESDATRSCLIVLDSSDKNRLASPDMVDSYRENNRPVVLLDHHVKGDMVGLASDYFVDDKACATSEIIYHLACSLGVEIDKNISTCLLTGIVGDTGSFENQNSTATCFNVASELMKKGARLRVIVSNIMENKEIADLRLWGIAMERLYYNPKYKTAITYITKKDLDDLGLDYDSASGVINYLNSIKSAKLVVLVSEDKDGTVKASLRTRDKFADVSSIARQLGGGGHVKASGLSFPGSVIANMDGVVKII